MNRIPSSGRLLIALLAAACFATASQPATAGLIAVTGSDLNSSRSTSDGGVTAFSDWTASEGGFKIAWNIFFDGVENLWSYTYTITDADGSQISKDLSHWLLETSDTFADASTMISDDNFGFDSSEHGPKPWSPSDPGNSSPGLPGTIYGIKLNVASDDVVPAGTYSFLTSRAPVWGDFYAKDGKDGGNDVYAFNTGFGTDPTTLTTNFTNWIATPDTTDVEIDDHEIPEPASFVLATIGGLGAIVAGRRRRKLAA